MTRHSRRRAKQLALSFTVIAATVVLVLFAISYGEDMVVEYQHYSEAVADGSVERGWMPPFVPASARSIREVHNIDTNRQWLRFEVPAEDAQKMISALTTVPGSVPQRPPRWSGPWPTQKASARLLFYRDTTPGLGARCVAVEPASAGSVTIFAWTC